MTSTTILLPFQPATMSKGRLAAVSFLARYAGTPNSLYAFKLRQWFANAVGSISQHVGPLSTPGCGPGLGSAVVNGAVGIDTTFDVRTDATGRDPDSHSKTLRRYHRLLWSKPLPSGAVFDLDERLHHKSDLGEFWLSSDAITHTYTNWVRPARLVEAVREAPPEEISRFYDLGCTIGAYLVFPTRVYVEGRWRQSINQARGIHPRIRDRFDLTLECIRRHYDAMDSPLTAALYWYSDFFALFESFAGYVDHFLLNDLVTTDYASVKYWTDFTDFIQDPLPASGLEEYRAYMRRSMHFIKARNERIATYATLALNPHN